MPKKNIKGKKTGIGIWWWLFLIIIIAFGLYHYFKQSEKKPVKKTVTMKIDTETRKNLLDYKKSPADVPLKNEEGDVVSSDGLNMENAQCMIINEEVNDFFKYLDQKDYFRELGSGMNSYSCFEKILMKAALNPPKPVDDKFGSATMLLNLHYFFKILDLKDIKLLKTVLSNEHGALEFNLRTFYNWSVKHDCCSSHKGLTLSRNVYYNYAGFFLNTMGGRSYLFRRSIPLRLLVTYYSLMIIHDSDKKGKNTYGIDIVPYIESLLPEMSRYTDFHFFNDYINELKMMEKYYIEKR